MIWRNAAFASTVLYLSATALRYDAAHTDYNLNQNAEATHPADYSGEWDNHTYNTSPDNWRFPFYTITLDRFVDGNPSNNEANGTIFEHDWMTNQFRFGGDTTGLKNNLDYIQGMGIKGIYLAGSPFINMPWSGDGYGPLDFTLLDAHHGVISDWRDLITEIHDRGMYVILDNTMATMGDLIGMEPYVNVSTPFSWDEHNFMWKTDRQYLDFQPGNNWNGSCQYPRMYGEDGFLIPSDITDQMHGCRISEFDQYGDIKGVGAYPSWQSQLSKFASVQDRLRAWRDDVREKINVMSCIQISMLDIDGFRMDKALQTTVDAQADFSNFQRNCAKKHGKDNFLIVGEAVGEIPFSAIYMGRGKDPNQVVSNVTEVMLSSKDSDAKGFVREWGSGGALDGAAFHYPTYGAMTRFLGLDGPIGFEGVDFVDHWTKLMQTDDMVNSNTGKFDPRHMFGMTNQDVFRWPSLENGTQRHLLGLFITTLEMPGVPLLLWGEEQEFNVLENLAADYVFGRTPMTSSRAWQLHGCYQLGEEVYVNQPFDSAKHACHDESVSLDHRNPSHPIRNILKRMYELRREYPALNDGYQLETLSARTYNVWLPGSGENPSPHGIWSVYRGRVPAIQDFSGTGQGNQGAWLVFHNENRTVDYDFDCAAGNESQALISAFPAGITVKNLFYPYDEYELESSNYTKGIENSSERNGCLSNLTMVPFEYKAFVPISAWKNPSPTITKVIPSHDQRIESTVTFDEQESMDIEIWFSRQMNCDSVRDSLEISSTTLNGQVAKLDNSTISCGNVTDNQPQLVGEIAGSWSFKATLRNVSNGVHTWTVNNASATDGLYTNARDRFMFRIGQTDNPMVFPLSANYTNGILRQDASTGNLYVIPRAAGADSFRYSLNFGTTWSSWMDYSAANYTLTPQVWKGSKVQAWKGDHVVLNFWSHMTGSSEHMQHSDLNTGTVTPRRWPHAFIEGSWNQFGYDNGLDSAMKQEKSGLWTFPMMAEWPTQVIVNVWGMNPNGLPDKSKAFGDIDGDGVLDWVPPDSLVNNVINVSGSLPLPYLGYRVIVNDANYSYSLEPAGSAWNQLVLAALLGIIPVATAILGVYLYLQAFYHVKFNKIGVPVDRSASWFSSLSGKIFFPWKKSSSDKALVDNADAANSMVLSGALAADTGAPNRRSVLIATMEYEIEDWAGVKVKIGGLGVMASLMGKNLGHQDLIWVVPCVGGIDYPVDTPAEVMTCQILGNDYEIEVQYHKLRNITFVLLDAPIFRKQTKAEPYPARMDDLESAVFYAAWNMCIAKTIRRFHPDLYHINDYHGTIAPLYLLPRTIPCALSLHNAEFQGLWSIRTAKERKEICSVFNLSEEIVKKYIQYGEVFNLLHAGASYLRIHQDGFGAVGVSKKYGKRSFARYPIFWGLHSIGALPNPDPSDTGEWNKIAAKNEAKALTIDETVESERGNLRRQAQEWAGLTVDPTAELFVFVGRWSQQKGIDLIADVFFAVLEENPRVQVICVGPVIDLYGKFAALKLDKMMAKYPGRVFSKPEFTMLPPYIFSGAEFALIPSRDEPFGLVAVEFGRKGALGVGSRVGGLGQMPGWWFTIESTSTKHLLGQFKSAIRSALASKTEVRAMMRVRSSMQRFPVAQWVEDLDTLQSRSIQLHNKQAATTPGIFHLPGLLNGSRIGSRDSSALTSAFNTAPNTAPNSTFNSARPSREQSRAASPVGSPLQSRAPSPIPEDDDTNIGDVGLSGVRTPGRHSKQVSFWRPPPSDSGNSSVVALSNIVTASHHNQSITEAANNLPADVSSPEPARTIEGSRNQQRFSKTWFLSLDGKKPPSPRNPTFSPASSRPGTPPPEDEEYADPFATPIYESTKSKSVLSLQSLVGERRDYNLQQVDPFFTDTTGQYYRHFENMLDGVDSKNSEEKFCIEKFLMKSEKKWFGHRHNAKLGKSSVLSTPASSVFRGHDGQNTDSVIDEGSERHANDATDPEGLGQFELGDGFRLKGLRKMLQYKIGDWQLYSFLLAFGQIIAANSYQINLITGENGQAAIKLYIIATIYLTSSICWWYLFRRLSATYVLSLPFVFYGIAFFLLGMAPYTLHLSTRGWIYNVATGMYAVASASGSFFFALNFGSDGGAPVNTWIFRACTIQGTQQIYVVLLWYWGDSLTKYTTAGGTTSNLITASPIVTAITVPIAVLLWAIGLLLFFGLPKFYQAAPGSMPSFYGALMRRKIVGWFMVMVVLQNYWLSAPYGRNWRYLFSSQHAPTWAIFCVIIGFFIFVWAGLLGILGSFTRQHSWVLPIFAIGLGAPRWCQMLWGTSNIGLYVPWGGSISGAILGRCIWSWLGVLDAVQGVGFGMILLQTLTRVHIAFTLCAAQVIGSIATIAARASAPNKIGPGDVFPDFSIDWQPGLKKTWFWVGWICQIIICVGFFRFFRKEQLSKP